ncbi:hypothetical protein OEZ85_013178 [Tetradesmus obliquus]|uniref:non-specific serine/threonine protein kinase n=1 Tax=Tetradesmus obliquus TaxID=3088 RepID=A0ABY8U4V9_TETOB|nr:hypothetical protein OEZ85_013178 [Tetradesmus obliquus]
MASGPLPNVLLNQRFELLGAIGHGQYGTAHLAKSRADGALVCLKWIPLNRDDHKGALQEAQLLSSMDHPNIIKYYDSFLDSEGALCIATTYCEDGDLFSRICVRKAEGRYFTEDEVMDTFIQVASALLYIHSRKIMHRDLKTQNIFLKSDGIVMLGDFGICKVLEKTADFATTVTGTPYYMAPEVCTNQPYTFKSDLWSLGCVLYELCTLTHAFAADSLLSLVYQIVRGSYPPIPADMFSADMQQLVQQLLTNDAVQRPSLQQVLALPYVQGHMARFNAEERRRIFCKQTSLNGMRGLQPRADAGEGVPAGAFEGSPSCESTMTSGLTPKQRIALKKEEERRRRQLELQVASMNVNRERQEVAKRKQSQLASSSLLGILPAASAHSSASTSPDRPASPSHHMMQQQQQWQQQGFFIYDEHDDVVNLATMPAQQQQLLHAVRPASGRPAARTGRDLDAAARTVSDDAAGDDTAASVAAGNRKTVSHHDDEYADEDFEDYEADFEEAADGCDDQDAAGVADELRQRQRIMQLVAEMSMSMSSVSMCSEDSAATPSTAAAQQQPATKAASSSSPRVQQQQQQSRIQAPSAPADLAHSASSSSTCSGVGAKQQAELAVFQEQLGGQFAPVHDYLVRVHKGAAAGGASVRGDEVKECLLGMVGRDKAKLEACFALEQVVFRAVLAGQ